MVAPGQLKRNKKLKNVWHWVKKHIVDPVWNAISPHVKKFLNEKFGSSLSKFAKWLNEAVIKKDKFGILAAIRGVVPGGVYIDQAIKIAGNLIENVDYEKVGKFLNDLIYKSDKQEQVIQQYEQETNKESKQKAIQIQQEKKTKLIPKILPKITPQKVVQKIQSNDEEAEEADEDEEEYSTTNQRTAASLFERA